MARRIPKRAGGGLNAHKMVANVAVEIANELFEVYMQENAVYKRMTANGELTEKKARLVFVSRVAPKLLEDARLVLVDCLTQPDDRVTPHMKEEIFEALRLDEDLRANRMVAAPRAHVPGYLH